jgi:hypothetical protein
MRTGKSKGKTASSRADDQHRRRQKSNTNVAVTAMSNSQQNYFDAAVAAAAAVHSTAPLVGTLPQPKPYRQHRSREEPHRMQNTMRKNPPKAPIQPSRAEGKAISGARSNSLRVLLTPKLKAHPQLKFNNPQPKKFVQNSYQLKPKTYTAPPMPILKRSETQVHRDNVRELKHDQRNRLAGDCDVAIQTVKGFIQQAKSKRIERKRQKAEKAHLANESTKQSLSTTPTSQHTVPYVGNLESTPKLLGAAKVQLFKDRVAAMLLWHQQRAELKRDMKREAQNLKLKAKISRPFNFDQGVRDPCRAILEDDQKLLIPKHDDVKLAFEKDMPIGLGITMEQTRRAPLIDLPIPNGNKARPTQSTVNEDIDNASLVTRFSDMIKLADEPTTSVPELPKKVAAKGLTKDLGDKEADKGTSDSHFPLRK